MEELEFTNNCESCGAQCCKNWNLIRFDPSIVDKNGICIYLDQKTNLCTIYDTRPDFCRFYRYYYQTLADKISVERFHYLAKLGCDIVKKMGERNKNVSN